MHNILIIGGKESSLCWPGADNYCITLFQSKNSVLPAHLQRSNKLCIVDFDDETAVIDLAVRLHRSTPFRAVLSFAEQTLVTASLIGERLGVVHNPVDSVLRSRNKGLFRKAMQGTPFELPSRTVSSMEEVRSFLNQYGRIIVKPMLGSGSRGVHELSCGEDLSHVTLDGPYVAELYAEGTEFSVESLTLNGCHRVLGVTQKYTSGSPHYVETGHDFPAMLQPVLAQRIGAAVEQMLTIIGHRWGPCHTEVKVDEDRLHFIETQTRFGGDQIWEMVWMVTGIHLAKMTIDGMLGLPSDASEPVFCEMAIRFFDVNHPHFDFETLSGLVKAASVVRVQLENDRFERAVNCSFDRHGYVLFGRPPEMTVEAFHASVSTAIT